MPYIPRDDRNRLASDIATVGRKIETWGELNFAITILCLCSVEDEGECYDTYNSIIGVLECVKQEFYRRVIADYENGKAKSNGDVF